MKRKWIQNAIKRKKGTLHRMLRIDVEDKIPLSLLNKIVGAKAGETIHNPTSKGKKVIKVTRLMERESILARNLKRVSARRKKGWHKILYP